MHHSSKSCPRQQLAMDAGVATVAVLPTIHLSVGAAIASAAINISIFFGFTVFSWVACWGDEDSEYDDEEDDQPRLRIPRYLDNAEYRKTLNLGVVGPAGSGKSSLINALRGLRPDDPSAAPVGVEATTLQPASYLLRLDMDVIGDGFYLSSPEASPQVLASTRRLRAGAMHSPEGPKEVRIWDLPGLDVMKQEALLSELGLGHFDVVLIVYSQRVTGLELQLAKSLEEIHKVPHLAVRSQVDLDVESEEADHGCSEEEVLTQLRTDAQSEGLGSIFLVSARHPKRYELVQLHESICHVAKARHRAHLETECPICFEAFGEDEDHSCCTCHWCGHGVCGRCARELRGLQGEAPCPFCRRWTALAKPPIQ